jgi:hypothetical protein
MADLLRPERLQIMLSADELRAVDDWRFKRRMPSRASAIRELLRLGLQNEGISLAEPGRNLRTLAFWTDRRPSFLQPPSHCSLLGELA